MMRAEIAIVLAGALLAATPAETIAQYQAQPQEQQLSAGETVQSSPRRSSRSTHSSENSDQGGTSRTGTRSASKRRVVADSQSKSTQTNGKKAATGKVAAGSSCDEAAAIDKATTGAQTTSDERVRVAFALTPAKAWYDLKGNTLSWRDPRFEETNNLLITVQDTLDQRFIPGCKVSASMTNAASSEAGSSQPLHMTWAAGFYRYSANVAIPSDIKAVNITALIEPPDFARESKDQGSFLTQPVSVEWKGVVVGERSTVSAKEEQREEPEKVDFKQGRHAPVKPTPYPGAETVSK